MMMIIFGFILLSFVVFENLYLDHSFLFSFARYQCFFSFLCCSGKRSVCVCVCLIHSCESFDFFFQWFPPPPSPPTLVYFSYHRFLACLDTQTHKHKTNRKIPRPIKSIRAIGFIHSFYAHFIAVFCSFVFATNSNGK